ncbi:MAG: hypothetical protein VYC34_10100 [Planctomycetota bacterium]|nr:hypothetical protein [Planctomycetota bacterium]
MKTDPDPHRPSVARTSADAGIVRALTPRPRPGDGAPDPWAHRRGEPRTLTLLWSIFLMALATTTVFSVKLLGPRDPQAFQPAARLMLTIAAAAMAVLWPMVRLSQTSPPRPLLAGITDLLAVNIPLQAVIWPLKLLTGWSFTILFAISAGLLSWSVLLGALIAIGAAGRPGLGRTFWMALALAIVGAAPTAAALTAWAGGTPISLWPLGSPVTLPRALTATPSGSPARMNDAEWIAIAAPALAGLLWWSGNALWLALRPPFAPAKPSRVE